MKEKQEGEITLILVRHGHRDNVPRERDNGLTDLGRKQARAIRDLYLKRYGKEAALLLSSPKLRCQETLEPLAELLGTRVQVDLLLTEALDIEEQVQFGARLEKFRKKIASGKEKRVVACSHGDWIPEASILWTGKSVDCPKGSWTEFRMTGMDGIQWVETVYDPSRQT